jgi:hypothetical protein
MSARPTTSITTVAATTETVWTVDGQGLLSFVCGQANPSKLLGAPYAPGPSPRKVLRCGVHLIVVCASREAEQFRLVFSEPCGLHWQQNFTAFKHWQDSVKSELFRINADLDWNDRRRRFSRAGLDILGATTFVLDKDGRYLSTLEIPVPLIDRAFYQIDHLVKFNAATYDIHEIVFPESVLDPY